MKYSIKLNVYSINMLILIIYIFSNLFEKYLYGIQYIKFISGLLVILMLGYWVSELILLGERSKYTHLIYIGMGIATLTFVSFLFEMLNSKLHLMYSDSILIAIIIFTNVILLIFSKIVKTKNHITISLDLPTMTISALLLFLSIYGTFNLRLNNTNIYLILFGILVILSMCIVYFVNYKFEYIHLIYFTFLSIILSETIFIKYLPWHSGDSALEYYFASLVLKHNFIWNPGITDDRNAVISIVTTVPALSIVLGIKLTNVFRITYPMIYAIVPCMMYTIFSMKASNKFSYIFSMLFAVFPFSYLVLTHCVRQGLAMFTLTFAIYAILKEFEKKSTKAKWRAITLVFLTFTILFHYATSYLITIVLALLALLWYILYTDSKYVTIFLYYSILEFIWYSSVALSRPYISFIKTVKHIISKMTILSSKTSYSIYAISQKSWSMSIEITKYIILIATILIIIGTIDRSKKVLKVYFSSKRYTVEKILTLLFLIILLLTVLPTKNIFSTPRIYPISLLLTAPMAYFGLPKLRERKLIIILILIIIMFAFGYGIISETIIKNNDYPPNVIISKPRLNSINSPQFDRSFYDLVFNTNEYYSSLWLVKFRDRSLKIYLDPYAEAEMITKIGPNWVHNTPPLTLFRHVNNSKLIKKGYIYLRTYNIFKHISVFTNPIRIYNVLKVYPLKSENTNLIYNNIKSKIYIKLK